MHIKTRPINTSGSVSQCSLAVIGAGPIGMHVLSRAISEGVVPAERTTIVDSHREPFAQWHRRVSNCQMDFLRSPASHGISRDFRAIRRAIRSEDEFTSPYHRPSVTLFAEHLNDHFRKTLTGARHVQGSARVIRSAESGRGYRVEISAEATDLSLGADVIVLAVGQPPPHLPSALQSLPSTAPVIHVHDDASGLNRLSPGSEVAIVGGGIAAAHLAVALSQAGHQVTVWNRDRFTSHQFDSDPCFVGPRCASLFSSIDDYRHRRTLIRRSRRPGSVPPDLYQKLRELQRDRRIRLVRGELTDAAVAGSRVFLHGRGIAGEYDAVVACTGFSPGPPAEQLVRRTSSELGLRRADDGYPVPSADLQWAPGLFVTGALAELEIGPPARNLVGAHLAARRIIPSLRALLTARK